MRKTVWKLISISALALVFMFVCGIFATATAGLTPDQARELVLSLQGLPWH